MVRKNLVLTGFMGTGKSAVGRKAARRLRMQFVDMDDVLEERAAMSISRSFAERGEDAFREMESALAAELGTREGVVIATGGGAMLREENRMALSRNGIMVCLQCDAETVLRRLGRSDDRPLLVTPPMESESARRTDRLERIKALLAALLSVYESLPWQVDTTDLSLEQVVGQVVAIYRAENKDGNHGND